MPGYHEQFLQGRIAEAYQVLLEQSPEVQSLTPMELIRPTRSVMKRLAHHPKKVHRAESLKRLCCGTDGGAVTALLVARQVNEVLVTKKRGKEVIRYGFDTIGPYREQWVRKFLLSRTRRLVRTRISFEELVLEHEGDPDELVNRVRTILSDVIVAIEEDASARR